MALIVSSSGAHRESAHGRRGAGRRSGGYARASWRIGVVAAHNGPAATLLVPPLAEAAASSIPILALVQDVPRSSRDRNAFQESTTPGSSRRVRSGCGAWTTPGASTTTSTWRSAWPARAVPVRRCCCCRATCSARPCARRPEAAQLVTFPQDRTWPAADEVARAAELLRAATHPIVIAGGGVNLSSASAALSRLQERAALPVGTTPWARRRRRGSPPVTGYRVDLYGPRVGEPGRPRGRALG